MLKHYHEQSCIDNDLIDCMTFFFFLDIYFTCILFFLLYDTRSLVTAMYTLRVTANYELCIIKPCKWDVSMSLRHTLSSIIGNAYINIHKYFDFAFNKYVNCFD